MYYELAANGPGEPVSIFFSNLSAAYLKLEKYQEAHAAAHTALRLEPGALKARYRCALARKHLNFIPQALVDIASLLTSDPGNAEAKAEFSALVDMQHSSGRIPLTPEYILESAAPHAHGSPSNPPKADAGDPHQKRLPFLRLVPPLPPTQAVNTLFTHGECFRCKKSMDRRDLKTFRSAIE
ncbi:hypothetical protein DFH09DRAFT_485532 [Mycena vulgaris]|nr:hypothetical protein DFH09DRAFT_485532 [Mycena vulgaris]